MKRPTNIIVIRAAWITFGALVFTSAATVSLAQPATAPAASKVSDPGKHFEITAPDKWSITPPNQPNMVLMVRSASEGPDDQFLENVNVVIIHIPGGAGQVTLDQVVPQALDGLKAQVNAKQLTEVAKTTLGGEPARTVDLTIEVNGVTVQSRQTYAMKGDDFYVVTYSSKSDTKPAMNEAAAEIMKSWTFLK
jgi:hypothetical protein